MIRSTRRELPNFDPDPGQTRTKFTIQLAGAPVDVWVNWDGTQPTLQEVQDHVVPPAATVTAGLRADAKAMLTDADPLGNRPALGKLLRAGFDAAHDADNRHRLRETQQDAAIAAATSLADLKTRWAAIASALPMPQLSTLQVWALVKARIDDGTVD